MSVAELDKLILKWIVVVIVNFTLKWLYSNLKISFQNLFIWYFQFNKRVLKVDPKMVIGKEDAWMVRIEDVQTKMQEELEFDIVVVCNG